MSDDLVLEVRVSNLGTEPARLFHEIRWGFVGGTQLLVRTSTGRPVERDFLEHDMLLPSEGDRLENYILLQPDHFFGTDRVDHVRDLVREPGLYRIQAEYSPPVGAALQNRPGIDCAWSVFSSPITIRVVP